MKKFLCSYRICDLKLFLRKRISTLLIRILFLAKSTGNENLERKAELNQEIERIKSVILEKTELINSTSAEIEKLIANQNERSKAIEKINADREQLEKRSAEIRTIERDKTSERETSGRELARLEERKIQTFRSNMMIVIYKALGRIRLTKTRGRRLCC